MHTGRIDSKALDGWCVGAAEDASLGAVRKLLTAFRSACHHGDPEAEIIKHDVKIMSDAAFQKVLVFTLREADLFFRRQLKVADKARLTKGDFQSAR